MSRSFKDSSGQEYVLKMTVPRAMAAQKATGIPFLDAIIKRPLIQQVVTKLAEDPAATMQAAAIVAGIPENERERFFEQWDGDTIEAASEALLLAFADLLPKDTQKPLLKVVEKTAAEVQRRRDAGQKELMDVIDKLDFGALLSPEN